MLLSLIAIGIGSAIGRLRGGAWSGVVQTRLRGKGFLVSGITATLVLVVIDPSHSMVWLALSFVSFIAFAVANLTLTGMIVMLIGISMNLLPVLANGAVPVSELALTSAGVVNEDGTAQIDGPRESTATANRFDSFGDVIPVPGFGKVISLGDLVILVALADIVMNMYLSARLSANPDDTAEAKLPGRGPAHAAPRSRLLLAPLPRVLRPGLSPTQNPQERRHLPRPERAPEHLAHNSPLGTEREGLRIPPPPTGPPVQFEPHLVAPPMPADPDDLIELEEVLDVEDMAPNATPPPGDQPVIKTSDGITISADSPDPTPARSKRPSPTRPAEETVIDLTDRRPIIDLTVSPSDEQLAEFLRRRNEADRRLTQLAPPSPGHRRRRGRGRRRNSELADKTR
ncbi:MAG: DUF5317 family protein [Acidimicrobiales bacterium]